MRAWHERKRLVNKAGCSALRCSKVLGTQTYTEHSALAVGGNTYVRIADQVAVKLLVRGGSSVLRHSARRQGHKVQVSIRIGL